MNNTYSGGTTILGGSLDVLTGGNLGTGAVTNSGSLVINYSTATVISNNISGNGVFIQSGSGTTTLTGSNSYTGATMVTHGTLRVNGSISASSGVTISAGATLAGSGVVSNISGAGLVAPGDPQILTATQVDPTSNGSTSFNFQFSQLSPAYNNATSSGNDVLHLTGATPFKFTLASVNTITVDFSAITGTLALGQVYYGGFFLDHAATLGIPTFQYAGTGSYDVEYLGFATVGLAAFGTGTVTNGQVMEFMMVPEPCTWALLVAGAGLLATLRRRVKT